MQRRVESKDWLAIGAIVVVGLIVRGLFMGFTADDAYITLRYAENLARGNGFVFNLGERVYGTTTPLFTFILAGLSVLLDHPLSVGKILNIVCDVAIAVILLGLGRRLSGQKWVGYLAGFLYAFNPVSVKWSALGMETSLYTLFICLSFWQHGRQRFRSGYVFAGLATLTRIEGALAFIVLLLADLLRRRRGALADALFGAAPVLLWVVFAYFYFGSPIPHSAFAKKVTYGGIPPLQVLQKIVGKFLFRGGPVTLSATLAALIGMFWVVMRDSRSRPILGWWFSYWIFLILAGARVHGWYFAPPMWVYVLSVGVGAGKIVEWASGLLRRFPVPSYVRTVGLGAVICILVAISGWLLKDRYAEVDSSIGLFERRVTRPIGMWLKSHAEPGDTVCLESIGAVAYYSGLYVLDEVGLVSPAVVPLNRGPERGPNFGAIVRTFKPKYYVWWESWEQQWWQARPEQMAWLNSKYEKRVVFAPLGKEGWAIWQRK